MLRNFTMGMITMMIVGVLTFSGSAIAQDEPLAPPDAPEMRAPEKEPGMPPAPGDDMPGMPPAQQDEMRINWKALNLTEEQRDQMQQLRQDFQVKTAAAREALRFKQQALRDELEQEPIDRAKIDALTSEVAALKQQIGEAATENLLAIKALLTEEQRTQLSAAQEEPFSQNFHGAKITKEQRAQMKDIMKASREANRQLAEEVRELRGNLREELLAANPDTAKIEELQGKVAEKELALEKARIDSLLKIRDLLTPEQRQEIKKFWDTRKEERRQQRQEKRENRQQQRQENRKNRQK